MNIDQYCGDHSIIFSIRKKLLKVMVDVIRYINIGETVIFVMLCYIYNDYKYCTITSLLYSTVEIHDLAT